MENFEMKPKQVPKIEITGDVESIEEEIMLFGRYLRSAREDKNLTRPGVAEVLGVKKGSVENWETGDAFPALEKLPEIAKIYNLDLVEVEKYYHFSKGARQREKDARKSPKRHYRASEPDFPVNSGSRINKRNF